MKNAKRWKTALIITLIVVIACGVLVLKDPLYARARSYVVMKIYTKYEDSKSLMAKQNIAITIPGGKSTEEKDWYPFMMIFNDDEGFSKYTGKDLSLSILYNFGAFSWNTGSSFFFQDDSPYYASFYGGYVIQDKSGTNQFGFTEDGEPDIKELFQPAEYDYKELVLKSFGSPADKQRMDILSSEMKQNVDYAGYTGWTQIDTILLINGPAHKFDGGRRAYIQYGNPLKKTNLENFPLIASRARVYARYFDEFNSTIMLYVFTPYADTLEKCDKDILSKTVISKKS
ncbi:hypothetical protein LPY66_18580 [Dehalobacter sp. DCM]|uniref:hypothetical protein n=1 Tax=Dehalobacter sp. DCM TaxID=2907827 RepID=UPI0030820811|nr:hypothetical protein LPY66_18580 [Dehalobacter sp. DCM]